MKVDSTDFPSDLTKADIVETFKAGTGYGANSVVRYEEMFLPSHKEIFTLSEVLVRKIGALCLFGKWPPRWETTPVLHVYLFVGTPFWPIGLKRVFRADDLAFKVGGERRVIVR